jgi:hypothetical protein
MLDGRVEKPFAENRRKEVGGRGWILCQLKNSNSHIIGFPGKIKEESGECELRPR